MFECDLNVDRGADGGQSSIRVVSDARYQVFIGIVKDITEQKRLSEQLHLRELAVCGRARSWVAHEVRNQLVGMTTTSATARDA